MVGNMRTPCKNVPCSCCMGEASHHHHHHHHAKPDSCSLLHAQSGKPAGSRQQLEMPDAADTDAAIQDYQELRRCVP